MGRPCGRAGRMREFKPPCSYISSSSLGTRRGSLSLARASAVATRALSLDAHPLFSLHVSLVFQGERTGCDHSGIGNEHDDEEGEEETIINVTSSVAPSADETLICVNPVS